MSHRIYVTPNLSIRSNEAKPKKKHPVTLHRLWAVNVPEFGLPVCWFLRRLLPPTGSLSSTSDFTLQARARRSRRTRSFPQKAPKRRHFHASRARRDATRVRDHRAPRGSPPPSSPCSPRAPRSNQRGRRERGPTPGRSPPPPPATPGE